MTTKLDPNTIKQQLFHLSLSLATVLICTTYMQYRQNWSHIGRFRESFILPIVFVGEFLKVLLARFYGRLDYGNVSVKQRQKKLTGFSIRDLLGGLILQLFCAILFAFACIILGAPVLYNNEQTLVLSLLLTLLTVSPTVFLLGGGGALESCFCEKPDFISKCESTALNLFKYNALGAVFGAWAGSVVSPLDWERDWQVYPIPNMVGALLGSALGNIYACVWVLYAIAKSYLNKNKKQS